MAVVTGKSAAITARDNTPNRQLNDPMLTKSNVCEFIGVCSVANGDSVGSKYIFGQIPSNARVSAIVLAAVKIGTTTTAANIGLYRTTADGGAAVSASFFASAVDLHTAATSPTWVQHQSGTFSIANAELPLWKALGLTSDPQIVYDVVATLSGAADGAGAMCLKGHFAQF